ncbi:peptidoglycan-binding protein [Mangrovimicrobium sediminis]|uniref:Peptidoglycan-binding protein n=1 Tax=Mangrovimicrobium sediminis TaxID=2562682 RepID=A0A4Z0LV51_9GAMM|nr:L,D-transpeptidase family protein [Haliea sp. SAOS-164]TGD71077.1 peptidoglycan-binding protein [Haliea sp. SAOS-164]
MLNRIVLTLVLALTLPCTAADLDPGGEAIRRYLEGLDAGDSPMVAGQLLGQPELLARLYRVREHQPLWQPGAPLADEADDMLRAIGESVAHGFIAERYHRSSIEKLMLAEDDSSRLALELLLTDAFLSQALHRGRGAVYPPNLDAEWQVPPAEVDALALLQATAAVHASVSARLDALWPTDPEYARLLRRRAEIAAAGDEVSIQIASGPLLKPGQSSDRVIMLKQRLLGPGEYTPEYDAGLRREVEAFQRSAGLEADGIVGDNTLEMLNATRVSWIERLDANLERWRWLPRETPDVYVRVNIAAFTLRVMQHGQPVLDMNVVVGKPYRRTPVFTELIRYLTINPYWNVPYSIATKDKLPLLKANPAELAANGYEVKWQGSDSFVAVDAVDWSAVTPRGFNHLLRQKPGPMNALGQIKFMLPNPYSVYLHDTPSRELFAKTERSFSSGCIRLQHPLELARWLLANDGNPLSGEVEALVASGESRTLHLKKPVPAFLVYFTAFSLDDGEVIFRRDIYGRDRVLIEALRALQTP